MKQPQLTVIENIRGLLKTRPFQPFAIVTSSSGSYAITNHDYLLFSPNGRTLFIFGAKGDLLAMVQSDHVTAAEILPRKRKVA